MITLAALRAAFVGIVDRHEDGFTTTSEWTTALDTTVESRTFPVCIWGPPRVVTTNDAPGRMHDTFLIDVLFLDQTPPDRTRDERDTVVSDMCDAARECFLQFHTENIKASTTLDLSLVEGPTIEAVYDRAAEACSGVRMTFTVRDNAQPDCVDTHFDVS